MRRLLAALIVSLLFALLGGDAHGDAVGPSLISTAKKSGYWKDERPQRIPNGRYVDLLGPGNGYLASKGKRTLYFVQVHLTCTKRPRYVKIRLARHLPDGSLDTTGTTTFTLGPSAPLIWEGTTYWEISSKYPVGAQVKVRDGKCYSDERQLKWWRP